LTAPDNQGRAETNRVRWSLRRLALHFLWSGEQIAALIPANSPTPRARLMWIKAPEYALQIPVKQGGLGIAALFES
jgi:hypothetical protein